MDLSARMNSRLDIIVPHPASNASVRTRSIEWVHRMQQLPSSVGTAVQFHGPGFDRSPIGTDRVLLLRNARRFTRGGHEAAVLSEARLGVYDLDDGLPWDDGNLPGLGHWWKRPWPRSLVARRAAGEASRVIAGNDTLADWASAHCGDVRVIPTCVEPTDYNRRTSWAIDGDTPLIGWIGSPATQGYLLDIAPSLREVNRRTGARVELIGADRETATAIGTFVSTTTWSLDVAHTAIARWDVGLMPLRDGIYERAKCGYKLLQYASAGVPAVGSPVGVNNQLLASMCAEAPASTDGWADAIAGVIDASPEHRSAMAAAGAAVADDHSYERWLPNWLDAIGEPDS